MKTAISKRINTAIKHLSENDFENALIQISSAIDRTAKKKYSNKKAGPRIKKFIKEYESFIYQFASGGGFVVSQEATVSLGEELSEIIYKSVRCALHHGDDLEDKVEIVDKVGLLGMRKGKFIINKGHIDGLLFAVIADEVNKYENCESNPVYSRGNIVMEINDLWGNLKKIEEFTGYKKVVK